MVAAALSDLPAEYRSVILEIFYPGRSVPEMADLLGVSADTVRVRCYDALRALKYALGRTRARGMTGDRASLTARPAREAGNYGFIVVVRGRSAASSPRGCLLHRPSRRRGDDRWAARCPCDRPGRRPGPVAGEEVLPGAGVRDDDSVRDYLFKNLSTNP